MSVKITTWNINSVRLRINMVMDFLAEHQPDVLALQEIKCLEDQFPYDPFREAGYEFIEVSGQKGYHGAATVSRLPQSRMETQFCPNGDARHVSTVIDAGARSFELHNFYIPAGGDEANPDTNPKFKHKLEFLDVMNGYFSSRYKTKDNHMVLVGDFNIAPHENDVWSHKQLLKVVSHTPVEVEALDALLATHDFTDCARHHAEEDEKLYSWWSYRARDVFKSNRGRRLDHIWVTPSLKPAIEKHGKSGFEIHTDWRVKEKPSDHVPVSQVLDI